MNPFRQMAELVALVTEQNSLLRELVEATGRHAKTPKANQPPLRQFTDKDVKVITKAMRLQMDQEAQAQPIWRETPGSGPGSGTTSPSGGSKSNADARSSDPPA
jgi:hypothetical protein